MELTPVEARIVGSLIEKQLTTPQYYPLTLNALVSACNQSSNRDPVVAYDEGTVERTLAGLKGSGVLRFVHPTHGRGVTRYRQVLEEHLRLETEELALLGVLLLRGPQTPGELRARTERMASFGSGGAVEEVLDRLAGRDEPLVTRLPRQPGQKEARYAHLLSGEPDLDAEPAAATATATATAAPTPEANGRAGRLEALEDDVRDLRAEVDDLRRRVEELRSVLE